jgi:hypothetical protein
MAVPHAVATLKVAWPVSYLRLSSFGLNGEQTLMDNHLIRLCGREIDRPGHICAFFDSPEEEYETLVPYFRDGLAAGERVLNIVDDEILAEHSARLISAGLTTGDQGVTVLGAAQTYLKTGRFEMERMVSFVEDSLAAARSEGRSVRTCGHMSWLRRNAPGSDRAIEYEARMNFLVPKFDCTFMCVYQLQELSGDTLADLMATHPYVILNGDIRENKFSFRRRHTWPSYSGRRLPRSDTRFNTDVPASNEEREMRYSTFGIGCDWDT